MNDFKVSLKSVLLMTIPQHGRTAYFNIGVAHIAKALVEASYQVTVLDLVIESLSLEQVKARLLETDCDVVLLSAISTQYVEVTQMAALVKQAKPGCPVVLGGHLATHNPHTVLENSAVDVCVLGEGEVTVVELLGNWPDVSHVDGIAFWREGDMVKTGPRAMVSDLDQLGMPAYELFDIPAYVKASTMFHGRSGRSINMITTRGCPYECHYCCKSFPGLRVKSLELIRREIEFLRKEYGIRNIMFNDELTILNKKRGYELCEMMRELEMGWFCQGRVNILDRDLLKEMKRSGCINVGFGVESGSPKILENMNKRVDIEKSIAILREAIKYGPAPYVQVMFGYVGENEETLKETEKFFTRIPYPSPSFFVTTPLPGTPLYDNCLEKGLITDEHLYLKQLRIGYMPGRVPAVNLSEFPDEKLIEIKKKFERRINRNFFLKGPLKTGIFVRVCWIFARKYFIKFLDVVFGRKAWR